MAVGYLSTNKVYTAIYNMIISQEVLAPSVSQAYGTLRNMFTADGGLFGDRKYIYSVDLRDVEAWDQDQTEASNLLDLQRATPACQEIVVDQFKKIWVTTDNYITKQAFGTEGAFAQFNSVVLGTLRDTLDVYLTKYINVGIGTATGSGSSENQTVTLAAAGQSETNVEKQARLENNAMVIAEKIENVMVELQDANDVYNSNGHLRAYSPDDLIIVWNADYVNLLKKTSLPQIFNSKDVFGDNAFTYVLPAKYFGATTSTAAATNRAIDASSTAGMPGDVPTDAATATTGVYAPNAKVICKILHKKSFQFLKGFETESNFFNARSLTSNEYLIFGTSSNTGSRVLDYPCITIAQA